MAEGSSGVSDDHSSITATDKQNPEFFQICIVGSLKNNRLLVEAAESFKVPVVFSENGLEYVYNDNDYETGFVLEEFEGEIYQKLHKADMKIWGPTAVFQYAKKGQPLPICGRPLYCTAMEKIIVCFAGFRKKEHLTKLVDLVHHMGGSIRKDFSTNITHLVVNGVNNQKYKYATALGKMILSEEWIQKTWERRHDVDCMATEESLLKYRVPPFFNCCICFVGFSPEEEKHVNEVTQQNGGTVVMLNDPLCTHVVVEDQANPDSIENFPPKAHIVKPEWFWASIQMDVCANENAYLYQLVSSPQSKVPTLTPSTPGSRLRKRKRLKETLGQLAQLPEIEAKRLSTELGTSISDSLLDATASPDKSLDDKRKTLSPSGIKSPSEIKNLTARQQVCMELLQTESNYVNILSTITKLFKEPLESCDHVGGPLLDPTEVKIIFGHLPPILEVHSKLRNNLSTLLNNWQEDCSVGNVILKHSQDLLRAYPPFINFFEKTKEMLLECDRTKPRFHAFLKICQSKPECGRQCLVELMIRPVQRLPSIILLLNDILKHTSKSNPDHHYLDEAIKSLKEVLTHINEDKRKTEGQVAMFDIVNDIENCPPNLLSSHRSFVTKADMVELSNSISGKGDNLTMFLFTDYLEICKRRSKMAGTLKSPTVTSSKNQMKFYKHIELMPLSHIKRVVDIVETEECKQVFALVCRSNEEMTQKLFTFALVGAEVNKMQFLKTLSRHMANTACRADAETYLTTLQPQQLDIETSDITTNSLSKAMSRLASKTKKVSRAFSFNKTPRRLKRAVSTMISPMNHSPYATIGHCSRMLPSQFPSSSISNLQEMDTSPGPYTFKISKKNKSSSFGPSASKLL